MGKLAEVVVSAGLIWCSRCPARRSLSIVTWMQSGERAGRSSRRPWEPVSAEPAVRDPWFSPRASTSAGQDRHRLARPEGEFSV